MTCANVKLEWKLNGRWENCKDVIDESRDVRRITKGSSMIGGLTDHDRQGPTRSHWLVGETKLHKSIT